MVNFGRYPEALAPFIVRAGELVTPDGVLLADVRGSGISSLVEAWRVAGVCPLVIAQFLTEESSLKESAPTPPLPTLEQLLAEPNHEVVIDQLITLFRDLYEPVQPFLDNNGFNPEHGFNSHNLEYHIVPMAQLALKLMREYPQKMTQVQINMVLLAIFFHDISNAQSRPRHALLLAHMLPLYFATKDLLETEIAEAVIAAVGHDEKTGAFPILFSLLESQQRETDTQATGILDARAVIQLEVALKKVVPQAQLWLWLVDKLDFGERRIMNNRIITRKALEEDKHFLAGVGWQMIACGMKKEEKPGAFEVVYRYSLSAENPPPNLQVYVPKNTGNGRRIDLPQAQRDAYFGQPNKTYFEQSAELALSLYYERWVLAALSAFGLYGPTQLHSFRLVFENVDKEVMGVPCYPIVVEWTREQVWQELALIKHKKEVSTT